MKLSGSIAAFANSPLPDAVRQLDMLGVDYIHVDCNDDPRVFYDMETIRENTRRPIDLHIISPHPEKYFQLISRFQIEQVSFQYETASRVPDVTTELGARLGLALTLDTDLDVFDHVADKFHFLMLMTTTPGKSGGTFGPQAYTKIETARKRFPGKDLHVDGGVNADVATVLQGYGIDCVISGSFLSKATSLSAAILSIKNGAKADFPVRDFMLARNALPTVRLEYLNLKDVLRAIDKYKMAMVLVVDAHDNLHGIITDGDIRRGILESGGDLNLPDPLKILNRNPVTAPADASLRDVLQRVEHHQQTVLFVPLLGKDGKLAGGLGLHQLLGSNL